MIKEKSKTTTNSPQTKYIKRLASIYDKKPKKFSQLELPQNYKFHNFIRIDDLI